MPEEWFVRVQGKEYGPVDLETLHEWKAEGRLIPQNEVRSGHEGEWLPAAQFPELFAVEPPPLPRRDQLFRRRTLGEIISESLRIYGKGFPQFFALSLMVALPSLGLKLSLAYTNFRPGEALSPSSRITAAIAVVMLAALIALWPIFIGALQFGAVDIAAGRRFQLKEVIRGAFALWRRIMRLCTFVYGSFLFWTLLPVFVILTLLGTPSMMALLVAAFALAFQVYMAGRLFVNFMFWQQSCTIAGLDGIEALRESKELARSRGDEPRLQRPLHRGALIASLWVLLLLAASVVVELPFTIVRLQGVSTFEEGIALMRRIMEAPAPDAMTIAIYILSSLLHAALRPLLAIAFVVLYFDARAGR